ncbi:MAG: hypothetical protein LBQ68_09670 [Clostridiales bacterium]|jgi:hypothetical protein|nr:hypothetical protein [Clostridiales bacterium]
MATIVITNIQAYSINVYITDLDTSYDGDRRVCKIRITYLDGSPATMATLGLDNKVYESDVIQIKIPTAGTTYKLTVDITFTGGSVPLGPEEFTVPSARPNDWDWQDPIVAGKDVYLRSGTWNSFCSRINEFRRYCGLSDYSFSSVGSGTVISADIVNQAVEAIKDISGYGTYAYYVETGTPMYADFFNTLRGAPTKVRFLIFTNISIY